MKLNLLGAAVLLPCAVLAASLPQLRIEPTAGGSIFYVKNVEAQPLTGYLIELVDYPGSYYALWQDDALEPIAPGQEKRIRVANMTVGAVPDYVKVQAAIYADGSTAGIPRKATQFVERRRFMVQKIHETMSRLENGQKDALVIELKQAAESPAPNGGRNSQAVINHAAGNQVLEETAAYLTNHSVEQTQAWLEKWAKALESSLPK